ncbi:structural maintenance of chromosomes domain-containing protein [Hibiscus syriacus]|uniref:Structural maintenance of chromosomes domain-containing protein n=1 Tax=Hibiscus syriacus TaxID=106335 RepID=A0A6A3BJQ0_HIBSY|nr:transcription factor DUO1-like [Hibiscus syriacus]KAE8715658.1 structural maintenance of chromosomes domain-containing protein [Hibiscus syriacus]
MASTRKNVDRIKGPWSLEEDEALQPLVQTHGPGNWSLISKSIPGRTGKSCRLRWCNQLSPEVQTQMEMQNGMGPQFFSVMQEMIRREVRNYMSGIEQNVLFLRTEAIGNAVVKRIGVSKLE